MPGPNRPAAATGRNTGGMNEEQMDDAKTELELQTQRAKIEARRKRRFSKVAELLDQKTYITGWTHPCLWIEEQNVQTSVSEFYPELNLAIDKFYRVDDHERKLTDLKKKALAKVGVKYAVLTPEVDLADIAEDLDIKLSKEEEEQA